ncbi:MAG: DnaJ domain-containing protein [Promethearchaeota archaeon]
MNSNRDYYDILEIGKGATDEEIKLAYRRLAKKYHPDKNRDDPDAKDKFIELKEAYDTLNNPVKRKVYNESGYDPRNIDFSEIFRRYDTIRVREILWDIFGGYKSPVYYKPSPEGMYI